MAKFRTHYDNLKVSRDAPPEVIQAAYRSLARKHHPDANGNSAKAEATMKILNATYEVLSDPVQRAKHDAWIAEQEGANSSNGSARGQASGDVADPLVAAVLTFAYFAAAFWMLRFPGSRILGLILLLVGWLYLKAGPKR